MPIEDPPRFSGNHTDFSEWVSSFLVYAINNDFSHFCIVCNKTNSKYIGNQSGWELYWKDVNDMIFLKQKITDTFNTGTASFKILWPCHEFLNFVCPVDGRRYKNLYEFVKVNCPFLCLNYFKGTIISKQHIFKTLSSVSLNSPILHGTFLFCRAKIHSCPPPNWPLGLLHGFSTLQGKFCNVNETQGQDIVLLSGFMWRYLFLLLR